MLTTDKRTDRGQEATLWGCVNAVTKDRLRNNNCPFAVKFRGIQGPTYSIFGHIQSLLWSQQKLSFVSVTKLWLHSIQKYSTIRYIQAHSLSPASLSFIFSPFYLLLKRKTELLEKSPTQKRLIRLTMGSHNQLYWALPIRPLLGWWQLP